MAKRKVGAAGVITAGILLALTGSSLRAQDGEIHWYKDLNEAVAAAQQTNQPMMIDFWADWCGPCRMMDAEVYTNPAVIKAFREKMIGVRIHFDLQPEVARKFNVEALPYLVFTNSYGTELMHHRGILEAEDLQAVVNAFPADLGEVNRLDRALQEDNNHFPSLRDMGQQLRSLGFFDSSNTYLEMALKHREIKSDAAQREGILYSMALNSLALRDGKSAASSLERCLKEFSKSPRKPDFLLALSRAYVLDEKDDKAKKTLKSLLGDFPASPAAVSARELLDSL
jgi:thiol-disulfide isomerase/thioredoxin